MATTIEISNLGIILFWSMLIVFSLWPEQVGERNEFFRGGVRHSTHGTHITAAQFPHNRGAGTRSTDANKEPNQPLHIPGKGGESSAT